MQILIPRKQTCISNATFFIVCDGVAVILRNILHLQIKRDNRTTDKNFKKCTL